MNILKTGLLAGLCTVATTFAAPSFADQLPMGDAEALGLNPARIARLDGTLKAMVDKGMMPGAVVMLIRDGQIAHLSAMGNRTPDGPEMTEDSIFRIYSMTKPIVSAAAMMLVEEGRLVLNAPVATYIPEFAKLTVATGEVDADGKPETRPATRPMTVQDLLRHTSGLTYGFFGTGPAREAYNEAGVGNADLTGLEQAKLIATLPLEHEPGTTWEYSRSTDVLGGVIEAVTGQSLGDVLKARIFDPLGMEDTDFYVDDAAKHDRIAEAFTDHAKIGPFDMFDPRTRKPSQSGGGGLVSTAHDYALFAQMMLNGGELNGTRLLAPKTVQLMTANHLEGIAPGKYYLPGPGYGFGLGYGVRVDAGAPSFGSVGEYYWGGAAGTYYVTDPQEDFIALLMIQSPTNRVPVRLTFKNLIYPTIEDSKID
ncbi:serine hydrolase domain-containing protein [Pseudooceanicola onchidii]|uniref:serine hydrolase domain-containing protein n=1 Tax=Pseudooceanicola onchidii TaxID=2562279 RepID=UPI0010AA7DFB|nr:serine hydrolase domain-containing protein [Pseudooceanicola onchidii]